MNIRILALTIFILLNTFYLNLLLNYLQMALTFGILLEGFVIFTC